MESAVAARSAPIEVDPATRAGLAAIEAGGVPVTVVAATALAALLHRYHGEPEVRVGHLDGTLTLRVRRDQTVGELLLAVASAVRRQQPALEPLEYAPAVLEPLECPEGGLVLSVPGELPAGQSVESVARHLTTVLRAVVAGLEDGELTVGRLPLLDEAERRRVLVEWNDTADPAPPGHFHELVERVARRTPDALAIASGETRLSYGQLDESANRLANHLAGLGVGPDDRVGIGLDRSPESLVAQLAAFKLGAAAVLLDSSYPAQRLEFMLADSAAAALVTSAALAERFVASCPVVRYDADAGQWRASPVTRPDGQVTDDTVCHVAYTSGSTGVPKAVLLRHGPLRNTVHVLRRQCGIVAGDRGSWLCSPGFGLVEVDCFPLLAAGASVHIPEPDVLASPERLRDWLVAERLTQSLVLTAMAERLWGLAWPAGTALKVMRIAGERARSWPPAELPFGVLNVYGSAEATVVATCDLEATTSAGRLPPIGRPVANVRTYVLDEDLQPVPPGVAGELFVSGASLSAGYLNRPDVASAKFLPNPLSEVDPYPVLYRTGDVARYWSDGTLEVVGRLDHEVKIRGYRVHLGEVESVLAVQPGVRQCAVLAREDGHGELRLVGYVEPDPAAPPRVADLRRALELALPAYAVPGAFVVGDLPTTPNGKIDRAALPEPPRTRPDLDVAYLAPRGEWERLLTGLFEQVLEIDGVGVRDSFFELGGDSLRAMRLLDRLRADHGVELGVELGMAQLHAAPTVAELAGLIEPPDAEPFGLTTAQRALAGAVDYFEWEREWLDVDRFRVAWRRMLDRHDALRVVLTADGRQTVLPRVPHDGVTVTDLSGLPGAEAAARIEAIREQMLGAGIATGRWPLHDLRLTLLPDGPVRIQLSLPCLTVDAASAHRVLFTELADSYEDPRAPLPALPHTFAGYARTAHPAPAEPSPVPVPLGERGLHRSRALEADVWLALTARAETMGLSPVAMLVAAFGEVVGAATGLDRFTIGVRSFDRPPGYESVVGPFATVRRLAVRTGNVTESARRVHAQLAGGADSAERSEEPLPVLVTDLTDVAELAADCPLGERIVYASRNPAILAELRIGGLHLDWSGVAQSKLGQFDDLLQDHLRLIDWFARSEVR